MSERATYIIVGSYDWNEFIVDKPSLEGVTDWFRENFEVDDHLKWGQPEFHQQVVDEYERDDWKSLQVIRVDLDTGEVTNVPGI